MDAKLEAERAQLQVCESEDFMVQRGMVLIGFALSAISGAVMMALIMALVGWPSSAHGQTVMPVLPAPQGTLGTPERANAPAIGVPHESGTLGSLPTGTCFPCTDSAPLQVQPLNVISAPAGTIGLLPVGADPKPIFSSHAGGVGWDRWGLYAPAQ